MDLLLLIGWSIFDTLLCVNSGPITTYCVDTVGLDSEMIRKYVKYQEA
jgi:hypothetical protein